MATAPTPTPDETWEAVCKTPLYQFLKFGAGRAILDLLADGQISCGKAAQAITEKFCLGVEPVLPERGVGAEPDR